ncbi:MAG TPA: tRNA (adenosine(37)-N6)-dimethylallyltransferase MiaA [Bacteroidia bacterium]
MNASAINKFLIVVLGPTAVGKTAFAIDLAREFETEIISADSRQFFREMNIGTAKPSVKELQQAKHHFINSLSIHDEYNVGMFERDALQTIDTIFKKKNIAIMAGGSGLYINAVCNGFDKMPEADSEIRRQLTHVYQEKGVEFLQNKLRELDEKYYHMIDLSNPHRLIRALEVCMATGKKYSDLRKKEIKNRPFTAIKIGLFVEREQLYKKIDLRVDEMIQSGLLEEVKSLSDYKHLNALNTVGYKELFDHLEGQTDLQSAIERIKQHTRNFAKRQLTWFRKEKDIHWFTPIEKEKAVAFLQKTMID